MKIKPNDNMNLDKLTGLLREAEIKQKDIAARVGCKTSQVGNALSKQPKAQEIREMAVKMLEEKFPDRNIRKKVKD